MLLSYSPWKARFWRVVTFVFVLLAGGLILHSVFADDHSDPKKVVEGYLKALAGGHASKALSYGDSYSWPADPGPFLTDKALAACAAIAPMKIISVDKAQIFQNSLSRTSGSTATVNATYSFGTHIIKSIFNVTQQDSRWYLDHSYVYVYIRSPGLTDEASGASDDNDWELAADDDGTASGLTLNGTPLRSTFGVNLFPGVYQMAVTNPLVTLKDAEPLIIESLASNSYGVNSNSLDITATGRVGLTNQAREQIGRLAQSKFDACLAQPKALGKCIFPMLKIPDRYDQSSLMWRVTEPAHSTNAHSPYDDMSAWRWQVRNGIAVATSATEGYYAAITSGKKSDGTVINPSQATDIMAEPPREVYANISNPHNIQISFS